jgi:hypothetical protein
MLNLTTRKTLLNWLFINIAIILVLTIIPENSILNIKNFIFFEFIIGELLLFFWLSKSSTRLLSFLVVMLPLNTLLNIVAFNFFGVSGIHMNIFKSWKDLLLLVALLYWGFNIMKNPERIEFKDKKVIIFSGLFAVFELLYIVLPIGPANFIQKIYSFRTDTIYLFFFILGFLLRNLEIIKIQRVVLYTGLLFSFIGIIERIISPIPLLIWLGMPDYTFYMTGGLPQTLGGLPYTYWAVGGIRRVGSLLLNPLDFAAFSLFALPTVLIIKNGTKRIAAAIILGIGIIFSLSRMPIMILGLFIVGFLISKVKNIKKVLVLSSTILGILFILILAIFGEFRSYVINTVTFKEPSAEGHMNEWLMAIENISRHPFGMGLATSGSAGARYGNFGGGENQYLILGVQLGWLGVAIFILMICSILIFLVKTYKENKQINLWLISNVLVLLISGITQQSFLNITITCITFLSLGFILKEREKIDKQ